MKVIIAILYQILPTIAIPAAFSDLVLGFTKYAYWANYYLPIAEIMQISLVIIGLEVSFYIFKFLLSVVNNFDLQDLLSLFINKMF